jgi:hypothetical protein
VLFCYTVGLGIGEMVIIEVHVHGELAETVGLSCILSALKTNYESVKMLVLTEDEDDD